MNSSSMAMAVPDAVTPEQKIVNEFFGPQPMESPRMKRHMHFHDAQENQLQTGGYGQRLLLFHREFLREFDAFRKHLGAPPVEAWDPAAEIPSELIHVPRVTSFPFDADELCGTPAWLTLAGGTAQDPLWDYTNLTQFPSLDQLGFSIDCDWHNRVHRTIGGDMATMHMAPLDPVFWCWHKWIDDIVVTWESR